MLQPLLNSKIHGNFLGFPISLLNQSGITPDVSLERAQSCRAELQTWEDNRTLLCRGAATKRHRIAWLWLQPTCKTPKPNHFPSDRLKRGQSNGTTKLSGVQTLKYQGMHCKHRAGAIQIIINPDGYLPDKQMFPFVNVYLTSHPSKRT